MKEQHENRFASALVDIFVPDISTQLRKRMSCLTVFIRLYIANGTVGLLHEWIDKDFPVSSRQIAEMMYSFSRKVIS